MNSYHLVLWVVLWLSKSFFLAASPTIESKNISHQEAALNNIIITFIAPPGGGKGTLSQQAEQHFNFTTVSTGNLCRLHKDKDSFLGEQMRNCLALGQLVPDTIISSMVQEWLIENADGTPIILDGYPRSPGQAQELLAMLKNHASSYSFLVIELAVPADSIVSRLSQRIVCSNKSCQRPYSLNCVDIKSLCEACQSPLIQRSDDTPEVIKNRMTLYEENAALITQYFSDNGIPVEKITITQESPQEVFELFKKIIHNVIAKKLSVQESKKELSKNNEQHRHYAHKELYTKLVKIIERLPHSEKELERAITEIAEQSSMIAWELEFPDDYWLSLACLLISMHKEDFLSQLLSVVPDAFINKQDVYGNTLLHYITREAVIRSYGSPLYTIEKLAALFLVALSLPEYSSIITLNNNLESPLHMALLNNAPAVVTAFAQAHAQRATIVKQKRYQQERVQLSALGIYTSTQTFLPVLLYYYLNNDLVLYTTLAQTELFSTKEKARCATFSLSQHICSDPAYCGLSLESVLR